MCNRFIAHLLTMTLAVGICFGLTACSSGSKEDVSQQEETAVNKEERKANSYNTVEFDKLSFQIPDYFGDNESEKETSKDFYAEKGEGVVYLGFTLFNKSDFDKHYSSDYKKYINDFFKGMLKSDDIKDGRKLTSKTYQTDEGMEAVETPYELIYNLNDSDLHIDGIMTIINNPDSDKLVICSIMQSEKSNYEYREAFRKMIDEAKPIDNTSTSETPQNTDTTTPSTTDSSAIRPEFKQTMDNYEAWFDHYCEVMKAYKENPSDLNLLTEMTSLLSEEVTMLDQLEKMDQSEMNAAELAYYIEVTGRIQQKLIAVGS